MKGKDLKKQSGGGSTSVTVLLGEARRLQEGHLSVGVQVFLVATKDDDDVGARQRACVRQPVGEGVVRLPAEGQRWAELVIVYQLTAALWNFL